MANEILGAKRYAVFYPEVTWNTKPGSPTYVHVPVTECGLRFRPVNRQADPMFGEFPQKHSRNYKGMVQGNVSFPLYGWHDSGLGISLMQWFLDWAFGDADVQDLVSKGLQWAEGPDVANKEWNGLRVDSATLQGSADSGVVEMSLTLQGASENAGGTFSAQALPTNRNKLLDCEFLNGGVVWSIAGTPTPIKSFQIQVQKGLQAEYLSGNFFPTLILPGMRKVTGQVVLVKNSDTYDIARRSVTSTEFAQTIAIKGLHNGTGTGGTNYTVATGSMPRCSVVDVDEQGNKPQIASQQINFVCLKPDTSSKDISFTYADAS